MARKALLVGINDYHQINDLKGCHNDVTNMRNILKTFLGFQNEEIRVLTDNRATKENILSRLKAMVNEAKAGDFLLFHFSGHGSQIRDRDGDELKDHMDELICPYDMSWDGSFITDDMLNDIFSKLPPNVLLEVIFDCCHSGTGLRDLSLGRPLDLGPEHPMLIRYLPPPLDIVCRFEGEEEELGTARGFQSPERSTKNHILWAGCMENQTSADAYIKDSYNGAFTYYFCKHLREAEARLSRKELMKRVRASLRHNGYSQIPQLECDATNRDIKALSRDKK